MSGLEMRYFILKPKGIDAYAIASRMAMKEYAERIKDINPELAQDLLDWAEREFKECEATRERYDI